MAGILDTIKKDINLAETWISSAATKFEAIFKKEVALEPQVAAAASGLIAKTEAFLAAATPAIEGEGLNFPADSVAYEAFKALAAEWQSAAGVVVAVVKAV